MFKKFRLPRTIFNPISIIGAYTAIGAVAIFFFLWIITIFRGSHSAYLGLFLFIIIPPFLIIGLLLIPIGMYLTHKKHIASDELKFPIFDFNKISHRNALNIFLFGTLFFLLLTGVGSYEAFHFTESNTFCGELCHSVMHPEYTAYQNSPHARVKCVECHVGEGAGWYVKSKLSGIRQVYGVLSGDYEKPIQTPISNLRPARETCEKCHWPQKFYARTNRLEKHYLADDETSEWNIDMTLKIGGEHLSNGLNEGIHWHINKDINIQYAALDRKRQEIPFVRYINKQKGDTTVFIDSEADFDLSMLDSLEIRTIDCIDCHNRPSHQYLPPDDFIDQSIAKGDISREIPEIKSKLLEIFDNDFSSIDSLRIFTADFLNNFYSDEYPDFYKDNKELVTKAVSAFVDEYSKNIFPLMKVKWSEYPSNIGHKNFPGCFRCHNDTHESEDGKVISRDCNLCHTINAQGKPGSMENSVFNSPLEFRHPVDIDEAWKDMNCSDCHSEVNP